MTKAPLRVLLVSSEVSPYSKTGGLADVASALPAALRAEGVDVRVISPLYGMAREKIGLAPALAPSESAAAAADPCGRRLPLLASLTVPLHHGRVLRSGTLRRHLVEADAPLPPEPLDEAAIAASPVPVYFIEQDRYFDRPHLYGTPEEDYRDNLERFAFFSLAVIASLRALRWMPDILHLNDWQTSLVAFYLREHLQAEEDLQWIGILLTIHNLAYQGLFPRESLEIASLPEALFHSQALEFYGKLNLLKSGILYADVINTVSESYAREIQTEALGVGLDGVLRERSDRLYGVLNGVDYEHWSPETDPHLVAPYSAQDLIGKQRCKAHVQREYGLPLAPRTPLIGVVSRLVDQKGIDLIAGALEELMKDDLTLVILGSGEERYHELFQAFAGRFPGKLGVRIGFDDALAHQIEAGSDFFLMPSRYEPCGLNQFYSLRYGTIPIVRATGGLDDSIRAYRWEDGEGNGFRFLDPAPEALLSKVREALALYRDQARYAALQRRVMQEDYSWKRSARRYIWLYHKASEAARE